MDLLQYDKSAELSARGKAREARYGVRGYGVRRNGF
jgi:hypothetical protein